MRFIFYGLFLFAAGCSTFSSRQPPASMVDAEPIIIGESRRIESGTLGQTRTYNVWLPPSYGQSDKSYPVLYIIDGGVEQDFHHISGLAQLSSITGMFRDIIVVGVETKDRRAELTSPSNAPEDIEDFPTHGEADLFRKFFRTEIMPDVKSRYRTSGEAALIGESLAGLFIMETFLREPDAVSTYIAISPSLWWNEASLAGAAGTLLQQQSEKERKLYLAIADEGGLMREGVLNIVRALQKEKKPGLKWTFSDRSDLQHSTIYHREALDALIWAFENEPKSEAH